MSVKNYPCLTPSTWGSLGDLVREIVENNKTLCSLDLCAYAEASAQAFGAFLSREKHIKAINTYIL